MSDELAPEEPIWERMLMGESTPEDVAELRGEYAELIAARAQIAAHEEWLKADSQYTENQRLRADLARIVAVIEQAAPHMPRGEGAPVHEWLTDVLRCLK